MPNSEVEVEIIGPDGLPVGVIRRRPPSPRRVWLHVLLFLLTFASTTLVGGLTTAELPAETRLPPLQEVAAQPWLLLSFLLTPQVLLAGLGFSIPLLTILLAHEMGHYLACRVHRLDASLPYFIPAPFGIGTLGAFIRIRSPLSGKRELLDVGAAGPLAGFIVALPVLAVGIALSHPTMTPIEGSYFEFGEPLLLRLLESLIHRGAPPGADLLLHPIAFAAWFGVFVTALNLLPFGQLDGGHIGYAMFGSWHRKAAWPLLVVLVILGFIWTGWWLWAVIALVMGVRHPRLPDEALPLDPRRRAVAWLCFAIFLLCFTPEPIRFVE